MDTVAVDQQVEEAVPENNCNRDDKSPSENWKSIPESFIDSDECPSSGFDCNICLDSVQEPVVTLCGHLYCWPCIYKWLHFQGISTEHEGFQQCPVCKAEVSESKLVPLFGRDEVTKPYKGKSTNLGIMIPRRPLGIDQQPAGSYSGSPVSSISRVTAGNMFDQENGMFGEMIYERVFRNTVTNIYSYPNSYNLAGSSSPRLRRHVVQADKSLSRISFFLFCCILFLCFLSF